VPDRPPLHDARYARACDRRGDGAAALMDTRTKIITVDEAAAIARALRDRGTRLKMIVGYFDVLTVDLVRRLREFSGNGALLAAVLDPPRALLASRARAELAAGLSVIDYVLPIPGGDLDHTLQEIQPDAIVREETADLRRQAALMEHVYRRQRE
jgi:hypothetical protein